MTQMLLIPDPRPLVERLGADFFRQVPQSPGVYLMRDVAGEVLYVGKAKNLRNRLRSYRVANPDRLPRRHLRLLRTTVRIDFQECTDESAALTRESELLRGLRPRFNRAGTWPGTPRFLLWRATDEGLDLGVTPSVETGWHSYGPLGVGAVFLRASLVRLIWCVVHPERGLAGMPAGWFRGAHGEIVTIPRHHEPGLEIPPHPNPSPQSAFAQASSDRGEGNAPALGSRWVQGCKARNIVLGNSHPAAAEELREIEAGLAALFDGHLEEFADWIRQHAPTEPRPFESAVREADLESLASFLKSKPVPPQDS